MNLDLFKLAEDLQSQLTIDRRHLHQYPELSFEEKETMRYIDARLNAMGVTHRCGLAGTGIVAEIRGDQPGKCLLIRADMDALPIEEKGTAVYASAVPGVMHACGHDAHTAIALNTCDLLQQLRSHLRGTVKVVFQPGEETSGGAKPMINEGILNQPKVDACIALHMDPDLDTGTIRTKAGAMYASPDDFYITIHGSGGHGAEPHLAVDPILIGAQIVTQLQSIVSRSIDPFDEAVVTVGSIHGGNATNIIPDTVTLSGTARALSEEMRTHLAQRIEAIVKNVCAAYGASYEYRFDRLFPPLVNDPKIAEAALQSIKRCLGDQAAIWGGRPTMAGEDFAYFAEAVPSVMLKLGCRNEKEGITAPIHNPYFDIDETALPYGVAVFADFALHFSEI